RSRSVSSESTTLTEALAPLALGRQPRPRRDCAVLARAEPFHADHLVPSRGALRSVRLVEGVQRPLPADVPELQGALHRGVLHSTWRWCPFGPRSGKRA